MRAVLLVFCATLILTLLGTVILPALAYFDSEERYELVRSFKTIDYFLYEQSGFGEPSSYKDMLRATRNLIDSKFVINSVEKDELTRALNLLEKLEWASNNCTEEAFELLDELNHVVKGVVGLNGLSLKRIDGFIRHYKAMHFYNCSGKL